MTKEERQSIILELLIQHNSILVTDLATHLNVSSVTIRKDLTDLEREKKLYRNHGKAILIDPYIDNRNVSEKEKLYVEEKRLIGMKAASLITPKDSILIASGTTMHALARSIVPADELTVITASMEVSNILASEKNIYIIQLGGILRHSSLSVVGKYAENILADFSCSKLFIGVDGIDLDDATITVNKGYDFRAKKVKIPKTPAGVRIVSIPKVLVDYLRTQQDGCLYVLHNPKGRQMTEQGWKRLWESYMRDLNVKYGYDGQQNKNRPGGLPMLIDTFTPHQLRHTFCTLMYFAGVDVMTARDQMGHKDISVTLGIYTALDKKFKKKKINRLDTYLKKSCANSG